MANKSKKRIKHEQYVYIKKLEREIKTLRASAVRSSFASISGMYDPVVLQSKHLIAPTFDSAYEEKILGYTFEKACREMGEKLMHSGAVEIDKTREFSLNRDGKVDCYTFTLRVLKRRY